MRSFEDFKDIYLGDEVIIAGNGPGLNNIPLELLESRKIFAMNWYPVYREEKPQPAFWTAWDGNCFLEPLQAIDQSHTLCFVPRRRNEFLHNNKISDAQLIYWSIFERIDGFGFSDLYGINISSSIHAAAILSHHLGFRTFLIVGFDCNRPSGGTYRGDGKGMLPHFYDTDVPFTYAAGWDNAWSHLMKRWPYINFVNLSTPTMSKVLPKGNIEDWL